MNKDEKNITKRKSSLIIFGVVIFSFLFLILLVSAEEFGYNYLTGELNVVQAVNYTLVSVNDSLLWGGNPFSYLGNNYVPYSGANQDVDIRAYDFYADDGIFDGIGSRFNSTLLIDGNIADGDATLVILSDINKDSCINLTESATLGIQICYDGSGINRGFVVSSTETGYEYFWVGRDTGVFYVNNDTIIDGNITADYFYGSGSELTDLNVTGVLNVTGDFTGYAINISFLYGAGGVGGMDMRGDPWYLSGTDFQIAENLLVDGNITANYFNGINISNLSNVYVQKSGDTMTGSLLFPDGTAVAPSISFSSQTNLGFYKSANNQFSFTSVGAERFEFGANYIRGAHSYGPVMVNTNPDATTPSFRVTRQDADTGIGNVHYTDLDTLCLIAGGDCGLMLRESGGNTNIGINTLFPNATLYVIGDVNFSGSGGNYAYFNSNSSLSLVGNARVRKINNFGVGQSVFGATAPTSAIVGIFPVAQFSQNPPIESLYFSRHPNTDRDTSENISVHIHWAPTDGDTGDVVWDIDFVAVTPENNELLNASVTSLTVTDSTQSLENELLQTSTLQVVGTDIPFNDVVAIKITRDTNDAADTYGSAASFVELHVEYVSNNLGRKV